MHIANINKFLHMQHGDSHRFVSKLAVRASKNISEDARKCHNHRVQPSRDTKRRREEEQIRTTQASHMKLQMHRHGRTATEEPIGKLQGGCWGWGWGGG